MIKRLALTATFAGMLLTPALVLATPITGSIGFSGTWAPTSGTVATTGGVNVLTDTAYVIPTSQNNSYSNAGRFQAATYNDFSWNPASVPITPLWSFTLNSIFYSFNLLTINLVSQSATGIVLSGTGLAHIDGFTDTQMIWSWSGDSNGNPFVFSSTSAQVVPEPASMLLLGVGLVAIGAIARRRLTRK